MVLILAFTAALVFLAVDSFFAWGIGQILGLGKQ
jgi:hypothetical protein